MPFTMPTTTVQIKPWPLVPMTVLDFVVSTVWYETGYQLGHKDAEAILWEETSWPLFLTEDAVGELETALLDWLRGNFHCPRCGWKTHHKRLLCKECDDIVNV